MKLIKNGDVLTFGDKIFLVAEGQLAKVVTVTKTELKASLKAIKKVLNTPIDGDMLLTFNCFNGNKMGVIKYKTYKSDKGWVYSTNGKKDVKLNNPKVGDSIFVGLIIAEPQVIDGDQYNFYSNLEAIFNGKSWIVKETPVKAKLVIKDFIKKGNNKGDI